MYPNVHRRSEGYTGHAKSLLREVGGTSGYPKSLLREVGGTSGYPKPLLREVGGTSGYPQSLLREVGGTSGYPQSLLREVGDTSGYPQSLLREVGDTSGYPKPENPVTANAMTCLAPLVVEANGRAPRLRSVAAGGSLSDPRIRARPACGRSCTNTPGLDGNGKHLECMHGLRPAVGHRTVHAAVAHAKAPRIERRRLPGMRARGHQPGRVEVRRRRPVLAVGRGATEHRAKQSCEHHGKPPVPTAVTGNVRRAPRPESSRSPRSVRHSHSRGTSAASRAPG